MVFPPIMFVPVEVHGMDRAIDPTVVFCCLRNDSDAPKSACPSPQTRTGTQRQRVLVTNRLFVCVTVTVGTHLTRPRFGFFLDRDTVFFVYVFETVDEPTKRPEVVCFLGHNGRPVRRENRLDVTTVYCRNSLVVS
ncbi:MAG: hypothetical protein J07HQW2_03259 [Haloquadratum walsbyi J07HQW2]|uniref:Uncharacterized protein n=1 Tax=Haloquadratum walsbyi J07HQW2 TaxID=1238425 RepID=U1NHW4_9EURY|nr:MAG: hypothetical protein J07HQW2_03259 [Haloquadratum walsbyi J07HQW2]